MQVLKSGLRRYAGTNVLLITVLIIGGACSGTRPAVAPVDVDAEVYRRAEQFIRDAVDTDARQRLPRGTTIDTVLLDPRTVRISFSDPLARMSLRPDDVELLEQSVREAIGPYLGGRTLELRAEGVPVRELVPNAFRDGRAPVDSARLALPEVRSRPLTENIDRPERPSKGLYNRYVALWHSHGYYYDHGQDRWMWQRPYLFQAVEDLLPLTFVVPYVVPMLENAGANVFLPRERDTQTHMVVVDNDSADATQGMFRASGNWVTEAPGFSVGHPPYEDGTNPFVEGTFVRAGDDASGARVSWVPVIPETGRYAVYVSYGRVENPTDDAVYSIRHAGGTTNLRVNQQMGAGTWVYLGTFLFPEDTDGDAAEVLLRKADGAPGTLSADAIRFGGGTGIVARGGRTSGMPRYAEGARYHLQYSGMPDTLVFDLNGGEDDYRDDYQSRGEWVNYLRGAPAGPNRDRNNRGLGIPIDLSLAIHTDAGRRGPDSTIGTLAIYSLEGADSTRFFPDGVSRFANRDFADILQTQLVSDVRALHDSTFARRSLLEAAYSESFRPNVPSMLLEILSHQNFEDMRLALDPRFRFDASRAIYKSILKFLAFQNQYEYVVQPLPVTHLTAAFEAEGRVLLEWRGVDDPLEPKAGPDRYVVYMREGEGAFDNGRVVEEARLLLDGLRSGEIYSFRVAALNDGGESFPSETLAVCRLDDSPATVLVVNAFDRVGPPRYMDTVSLSGFVPVWDQGVPDRDDLGFAGFQYNFDKGSDWVDDDAPGHGASYGDFASTIVAGNTFDYPFVHGQSIRAAGFSFVSASDEAVEEGLVHLEDYAVVDWILGEERTTTWLRSNREAAFRALPDNIQATLVDYAQAGGRLFLSGAHGGSDLFDQRLASDTSNVLFRNVLKTRWVTDNASRRGGVYSLDSTFAPASFTYVTEPSSKIYGAESADGLAAADSTSSLIFRYAENGIGAGVAHSGTHRSVVLGFPFEVVSTRSARDLLMRSILLFLTR